MSGRFDAFFSLTLCHALVTCILFAGALSVYAPMTASYYQLVSLTALLYWVFVLFILTVLSSTIQLVMRMIRIGSGQLLQRYRRVGVMLANPRPSPVTPDGRRSTAYNVTPYNNSSNSNVAWFERLRRLAQLSRQNNSNNNDNNNAMAAGEFVASDATVVDQGLIRSLLSAIQKRSLLRRHPYRSVRPMTTGLNTTTGKYFAFNECSSNSSLLSSHKEKTSKRGLSLQPAQSRASSASCFCNASDAELDESRCLLSEHSCCSDAEPLDTAAQFNMNNNNGNETDNNTNFVAVTVESSPHENTTSSAGQEQLNYSSNAGADDAPRASRTSRSSAARASRQSSVIDQIVGRVSQSSVVQAIAAPRKSSMDVRQSSAGRPSESRRSSAGQAARRSSTRELSIADRKSSTDARRSSAGARQSGAESRRSSATERRRSSTRQSMSQAARKSSGRTYVADDDNEQRHYRKGIEASEKAARRSYGARNKDVEQIRMHGFGMTTDEPTEPAADSCGVPCCEPLPATPCESCCRPMVRRQTCWCRCPGEIHDPALLDDCCGSRDGRLLSLPGFPRSKAQCNSCFTPCKPLPELCSKAPDCEPKCRFTSKRECGCACPCAKECAESTGVVGDLLNKLGLSPPAASRRASSSRASFTSSFKSIYSRGSSAGNTSRNNPALPFPRSPVSSPTNFNVSHANSPSVFDVYWSNFWDNIAPDKASNRLPLNFETVPMADLKTFTGHLVESVIAKLKADYAQPQNNSTSNSPCTVTPSCKPIQEEDIEVMCQDILFEMMSRDNRKSTTTKRTKVTDTKTKPCYKEPTTVEPSEPCDESAASVVGSKDVTDNEDGDAEEEEDEEEEEEEEEKDVRTDLLLDDASLREFAGGVVEGLYTAMRRKLWDSDSRKDGDENNCSNVIANADDEIRAQVRSVLLMTL